MSELTLYPSKHLINQVHACHSLHLKMCTAPAHCNTVSQQSPQGHLWAPPLAVAVMQCSPQCIANISAASVSTGATVEGLDLRRYPYAASPAPGGQMCGRACAAGGPSRASRAPHWSAASVQMSRLWLRSGEGPCMHGPTVLSRLEMGALCSTSCEVLCIGPTVPNQSQDLPVLTPVHRWQSLTSGGWRPLQCGRAGAAPGDS